MKNEVEKIASNMRVVISSMYSKGPMSRELLGKRVPHPECLDETMDLLEAMDLIGDDCEASKLLRAVETDRAIWILGKLYAHLDDVYAYTNITVGTVSQRVSEAEDLIEEALDELMTERMELADSFFSAGGESIAIPGIHRDIEKRVLRMTRALPGDEKWMDCLKDVLRP